MSTIEPSAARTVRLKAECLSHGLVPTKSFLSAYGHPFLEKRRAYGNPDDACFRVHTLPQELFILPNRLICAVNVRTQSPWRLDWSEGQGFYIYHTRDPEDTNEVSFPLRPAFYDQKLPDGESVCSVVTLYGGGSLGVFAYGRCVFTDISKPCAFCSLAPNRSRQTAFPSVVEPDRAHEALLAALRDDSTPITQVMINGGCHYDMDHGFRYYVDIVREARAAIDSTGREVELHLIVAPPRDLSLIGLLQDLDVSVAMNLEFGDPDLFRRYCPGKHELWGQEHIEQALLGCVDKLGAGRVHSIFVGGLEPVESLTAAMERAATSGITPIINVFHADPETPLEKALPPTPHDILEMGHSLQMLFARHPFARPFYLDCGRNSLDTEAYRGFFG